MDQCAISRPRQRSETSVGGPRLVKRGGIAAFLQERVFRTHRRAKNCDLRRHLLRGQSQTELRQARSFLRQVPQSHGGWVFYHPPRGEGPQGRRQRSPGPFFPPPPRRNEKKGVCLNR